MQKNQPGPSYYMDLETGEIIFSNERDELHRWLREGREIEVVKNGRRSMVIHRVI